MSNEELLHRYAMRISFAAAAEADARPKPIIVAVGEEPQPKHSPKRARVLH
jgi:hypothetical protein